MSLLLCKAIQIFYIIFTISPIYQNIKNKFCCTEKQQQFSAVMVSGKCPKIPDPCESQPHKGPLTSKLNSKTIPVLPTLKLSFIFPFNLLPSPVHLTGFSFCFLLSSNNNNSLLPIRQTINNIFEAGSWMLPIERALQEDGEVCDFFSANYLPMSWLLRYVLSVKSSQAMSYHSGLTAINYYAINELQVNKRLFNCQ